MSEATLDNLPVDGYTFDEHTFICTADVFAAIDDYTRSCPTGPHAGRVYRKDLHWSGPPANWFVFIVIDDPADPHWQLHLPRRVVLV